MSDFVTKLTRLKVFQYDVMCGARGHDTTMSRCVSRGIDTRYHTVVILGTMIRVFVLHANIAACITRRPSVMDGNNANSPCRGGGVIIMLFDRCIVLVRSERETWHALTKSVECGVDKLARDTKRRLVVAHAICTAEYFFVSFFFFDDDELITSGAVQA